MNVVRKIFALLVIQISTQSTTNKSGFHLNWKGTNKLVENFLFASSKFDNWHKTPVSNTNLYESKLGKSESQQKKKMILGQSPLKTCEA